MSIGKNTADERSLDSECPLCYLDRKQKALIHKNRVDCHL